MSCLTATGQFKAPSVTSEGTAHTAEVLQQMSYIGGMNYDRARLQEATAPRPSRKGTQVRPPALLVQTGTTGPHGDSRSSSPSSKAASARFSAYRAVHEAAKARKALLDAQIGVKQAASQLSERKARCDREHHAIVEEIEAVQTELRTSTERQAQGQEVQSARMDAMGYRMAEMKDLMAQREVRMDAQMQEVCSQIQAMGTMLKNVQPRPAPASSTIKELLQDTDLSLPKPMKSVSLKTKENVITAANPSSSTQHLARYATLPQPLISNGEAVSTSTQLIPPVSTKLVPPVSTKFIPPSGWVAPVDGWLPVMKRFLERVHAKSPKIDNARAIIDHL